MLQILVVFSLLGGAYVCNTQAEVVSIINSYEVQDNILAVYMVPKYFVNIEEDLKYPGQTSPYFDEVDINKPNTLNGYVPKNNKLLTFPYCALILSNNNGSSNTYQYELFNQIDESNNCIFNIKGVPCTGGSIKAMPLNYKMNGDNNNEDEGLIAGKFPTLSWSKDEYINWLTQNSVNIGLGVASNLLTIASRCWCHGNSELVL